MKFIVNNELINTNTSLGLSLLTYLRQDLGLCGTKIGCQEGDCGACTVIVGKLDTSDTIAYQPMTSCLIPLANCEAKHIVTIEGIGRESLNFIQKALVEEGVSQCGFCTPGIVMSLIACMLSTHKPSNQDLYRALDGNICRCTGYKSIERSLSRIEHLLSRSGKSGDFQGFIDTNCIPAYFGDIKERLSKIIQLKSKKKNTIKKGVLFVGGATDIMLQKADKLHDKNIHFLAGQTKSEKIRIKNDECFIPANTTIESLHTSGLIAESFPAFRDQLHLFASTPIRNMATLAGNIANASPIGDLTIMMLALGAKLKLKNGKKSRNINLDQFYLDYKKIDLRAGEWIDEVSFKIPPPHAQFSFEKVSKRRILDIATVNSACLLLLDNNEIRECRISVGGVAPTPLFLEQTSALLKDSKCTEIDLQEILKKADEEISPISDVRGSAAYKRLLLRQFTLAHLHDVVSQKHIHKILMSP